MVETNGCGYKGEATNVNETKFSNVHTLLAVENPLLRKGLSEAFRHAGFAKLADASAPDTLGKALSETPFDLIIMVAEMQGVFVGHLISELRHGRLCSIRSPWPSSCCRWRTMTMCAR